MGAVREWKGVGELWGRGRAVLGDIIIHGSPKWKDCPKMEGEIYVSIGQRASADWHASRADRLGTCSKWRLPQLKMEGNDL